MSDNQKLTIDKDEDGLIGRVGRAIFGRSWRSSLTAFVAAGATAAPAIQAAFEHGLTSKEIPGLVLSVAIAIFGRTVKDDRATGLPGK